MLNDFEDEFEDEFSSCGSTVPDESAVNEICEQADVNQSDESGDVTLLQTLDEMIDSHEGQWFIYDLETVPDETRFPEPVLAERPDADVDVKVLVGKTADDVNKVLGILSDSQLSELMDLEGASKKPRKTVIDNIKKAFKDLDSDLDSWKHLALEPYKCRIVALSFAFLDTGIQAITAENLDDEMVILNVLAKLTSKCRRVGYNIINFDDRVVAARFMLRNIHTSKPLNMKRWNNPDRFELMDALYGTGTAMPCKDMAQILGITIPAGDIRGDQVFDLVRSQQWSVLRDYSASDVFVERNMFNIVRRYVEV